VLVCNDETYKTCFIDVAVSLKCSIPKAYAAGRMYCVPGPQLHGAESLLRCFILSTGSQEMAAFRGTRSNYRMHRSPPSASLLSQMDQLRTHKPCFPKTHLILSLIPHLYVPYAHTYYLHKN
jgi:hypothetical protein